MKIFVTGVAGFLGSYLADELLKKGHEVVGVDNLLGGYKDNIPADHTRAFSRKARRHGGTLAALAPEMTAVVRGSRMGGVV